MSEQPSEAIAENAAPVPPPPDAQADRQAEPIDHEQPPRLPFVVVGVGASAGGLEAFIELMLLWKDKSKI